MKIGIWLKEKFNEELGFLDLNVQFSNRYRDIYV